MSSIRNSEIKTNEPNIHSPNKNSAAKNNRASARMNITTMASSSNSSIINKNSLCAMCLKFFHVVNYVIDLVIN